jgi:hypothetical protein
MSASTIANKDKYIELARRFVKGDIKGKTFVRRFFDMRRSDISKDEKVRDTWPERYDLQLADAFSRGDLTAEEFTRRWETLWGYGPKDKPFLFFVEALFQDADSYEPDEELYKSLVEDSSPLLEFWFHGEQEFRQRVMAHLVKFLGKGEV